jgi:uncharacterized protein
MRLSLCLVHSVGGTHPIALSIFECSWCMQLDKEEWNACATSTGDVNPFLLHEFFGSLESSGSACEQRGWVPCHVAIREGPADDSSESAKTPQSNGTGVLGASQGSAEKGATTELDAQRQEVLRLNASAGRLLGVVPAYLKSHSYGEYVFDSSWANLYAQACIELLDSDHVLVLFCH